MFPDEALPEALTDDYAQHPLYVGADEADPWVSESWVVTDREFVLDVYNHSRGQGDKTAYDVSLVVSVENIDELTAATVDGQALTPEDFTQGRPAYPCSGRRMPRHGVFETWYVLVPIGDIDEDAIRNVPVLFEGTSDLRVHFDVVGEKRGTRRSSRRCSDPEPTCKDLGNPFSHDVTIDEEEGPDCDNNEPPVARCAGQIHVPVDDQCNWTTYAPDFDGGSYDPEGFPLTFEVFPESGDSESAQTLRLRVFDVCGDYSDCYGIYALDEFGNPIIDENGEWVIQKHTMAVPIDNTPPVITVGNPVVTYEMNEESYEGWPDTWMWPTSVLEACQITLSDNCTPVTTVYNRWGIAEITPHAEGEVITWDVPYEGHYRSEGGTGIFASTTEFSVCLDRNNCVPRSYTLTIAVLDAPFSLGEVPQEPNVATATCEIVIVDNGQP